MAWPAARHCHGGMESVLGHQAHRGRHSSDVPMLLPRAAGKCYIPVLLPLNHKKSLYVCVYLSLLSLISGMYQFHTAHPYGDFVRLPIT